MKLDPPTAPKANFVSKKLLKNSPLGLFFQYIQTHFKGYFWFFRITVLVSTKCISKIFKNNVIY